MVPQVVLPSSPHFLSLGRFDRDSDEEDASIVFDWPGVKVGLCFSASSQVAVRINGGGNSFSVRVEQIIDTEEDVGEACSSPPLPPLGISWSPPGLNCRTVDFYRIDMDYNMKTYILASDLDPSSKYLVILTKRTESVFRSILTNFYPAELRFFELDQGGEPHALDKEQVFGEGFIEVLGDSDTCGFGLEGARPTGTYDIFSIDFRAETCENTYISLVGRALGLGTVLLAWSGGGVAINAPFCGKTTVPCMWRRLVSTDSSSALPVSLLSGTDQGDWKEGWRGWEGREGKEQPRLVLIYLGGNDFVGEPPSEDAFVQVYSACLSEVRKARPSTPILCLQASGSCCSSEGCPSKHSSMFPKTRKNQETLRAWTEKAILESNLQNVHFLQLDVPLELPSDYALMMHWSLRGNIKIGKQILDFIFENKLFEHNSMFSNVESCVLPQPRLRRSYSTADYLWSVLNWMLFPVFKKDVFQYVHPLDCSRNMENADKNQKNDEKLGKFSRVAFSGSTASEEMRSVASPKVFLRNKPSP